MNKAVIVLIIIAIIIAVIVITRTPESPMPVTSKEPSLQDARQMPEPVTPPPTALTTVTSPSEVTVAIDNFTYAPKTLTIKAGTRVTWTNKDDAPHTATSDTAGIFDSGKLATGQSYSHTFTTPGTIDYHCTYHPMMEAQIIVTP